MTAQPNRLAYDLPVEIQSNPSETWVEVRGSVEDVSAWLEQWGRRYGAGYDPSVDADDTKNGVRVLRVSRLSSCD